MVVWLKGNFLCQSTLWFKLRSNLKLMSQIIGNKAKGESQHGGNTKTKHAKFSEKINFSYLLIHTRTYAYHGVRNVRFSENLACIIFLLPPFWDLPFCLINDKVRSTIVHILESSIGIESETSNCTVRKVIFAKWRSVRPRMESCGTLV